jgi:hypothetical protein
LPPRRNRFWLARSRNDFLVCALTTANINISSGRSSSASSGVKNENRFPVQRWSAWHRQCHDLHMNRVLMQSGQVPCVPWGWSGMQWKSGLSANLIRCDLSKFRRYRQFESNARVRRVILRVFGVTVCIDSM